MAAPAAPRKRGALTSSTAPRRPRADGAVTAPAVAASRRVASATEVDLVRRLEQVNLDKTATSCRPAASTSRLQTRSGTISKAAPGTTKAAPVSRTGSPPATVDSLLGSINNTLRKLGKTRKAASQPTSASKVLVDEVKTSFPRLQASLANLRKLATSGDDAGQPPTPSRLLSIERAAIMLVSHCIEAGLVSSNCSIQAACTV